MPLGSRAAFVVFCVAVAACGGETAGPPGSAQDAAAERHAACATLGAAWCSSARSCLSATFEATFGDDATCIERRTALCEGTRFGRGSLTTIEDVRACAAKTDLSSRPLAEQCAEWLRREVGRNPPEECRPTGALAEGGGCVADGQCEQGTCLPGDGCGRCGTPASSGEPCGLDGDCARDLACRALICVLRGDAGAQCSGKAPCRADLACVAGTCAERGGPGDACESTTDAAPIPLPTGTCALWPSQLACNSATKVCEAYHVGGSEDAVCGLLASGPTLCDRDHVCRTKAFSAPGMCVPVFGDHASCTFIESGNMPTIYPLGGPCRAPATCFANRCEIPDTGQCGGALPP